MKVTLSSQHRVVLDAILIRTLESIVSTGRLQRYKNASSSDLETATLYLWNIELSQTLLPSIAVLEVTLRNAVHETLRREFGDYWFQQVLHPERYKTVSAVIAHLQKKHATNLQVGHVIAELTFGMWPHLFSKYYRHLWWDLPRSKRIGQVLSGHPKVLPSTREELNRRLLYFNALRNRAMHHEAIFQGIAALNHPILPIDVLHTQLLETIGWINPAALRLVSCLDQFPRVHSQVGLADIENAIKGEFNIP